MAGAVYGENAMAHTEPIGGRWSAARILAFYTKMLGVCCITLAALLAAFMYGLVIFHLSAFAERLWGPATALLGAGAAFLFVSSLAKRRL